MPGCRDGGTGEIKRLKAKTMQQGISARGTIRNCNAMRGRWHAIAVMTAALLMALPFAAHAQSSGQVGGQATPGGAAVSPAPATTAPATGAVPAPLAPSASAPTAPPAPASAALPGEHMISGADLPEDLSPWGMFENSDLVVKAVIIGLAFASLVTWTVWLAKTLELRTARSEVRRDLRVLNNSVTLAQAHDQLREGNSPVSQLMRAADQEIRLSANLRADGLKERIALQLERIEMAVSRKVSRGTGV